jgi:hypothetical protein
MLDPLERLLAIEEIKQLKARYCRLVDEQADASEFETIFTQDAEIDYGVWGRYSGLRAWIDGRDQRVGEGRHVTAHHLHMPEIEILTEDTARAIWPLGDYIAHDGPDSRLVIQGYGQYHEQYRRVGGRWLISSLRLTRFHVSQQEDRKA